MKLSIVTALLCTVTLLAEAQNNKFTIGVHTGINGLFTRVPDYTFIRGETVSYQSEGALTNLSGTASSWYAGAAFEARSRNEKFSISAGVRYKGIRSALRKDFWNAGSGYFYVMNGESGTTTEYLRVKNVSQYAHYIGVPIDVRFFPFGRHRFTIYFKGGISTDFRLDTKTEVEFVNNDMSSQEESVAEKFGTPRSVVSILNTAVGVEIGKNSKVPLRLEMGPCVLLSDATSSLVKTPGGFDVLISVQLPL